MTSFLHILADAAAPAPTPAQSFLQSPIIMVVCVGVIFYFLIIRPQKQQQQKLQTMVAALKTGDKVVTNSGIHGIISNVKEGTTLSLKIADNVKIEIDKSAIANVIKD